jgi:hypothetical protein
LVKTRFEAEALVIRINLPSVPPVIPVKVAVPAPVYLNRDPVPRFTLFCVPVVV